jgi:hypothetical protein
VLNLPGGVTGRMPEAYANRFNFVGGAKARGGDNPFGGIKTPALGQMIGFADHLRAQGMMEPLNVVSAYRSPKVQEALRKAERDRLGYNTGRIAKNSVHSVGNAIDITHPGMSNEQLAAQAASYPGFSRMMGYGHEGSPSQGSHLHVEPGVGPLKGMGYVGGKKVASIVSGAPRPSAPIQTASLGPIAMSAPPRPAPPIPQRNPMRTNIPVPQSKPIGPQIASLGTPVPQMAPGGFFPDEIDAARAARPAPPSTFAGSGQPTAPAPREANPMTSSTPATMVDYNRVIAALEQHNAQQRQAQAPRGPSAPNADMIARAYSDDARVNERRYDAPDLAFRALNTPAPTTLSAPQMHPDRAQELAARRSAPQPLVNTRSATAVEGPQPVASPYPSNLTGGPPTRAPYYSQGDTSAAEVYAGPGLPDPPGLQNMPPMEGLPSDDAFSMSTQYKAPAAPPISTAPQAQSANAATGPENYTSPPEFDAPLNYLRERYQRQRTAPKTHEIQEPGQVPGRPSAMTGLDPKYDQRNPYGTLPDPTAPARFDKEGDDAAGKWRKAETYIKTANSGRRDQFGNRNERSEVSRLARVLRKRGEADSQREARELAEQIIDYSRITYS